jgi:hypothetical protein
MRKINFLKIVLGVATAMLMTNGAFGQVNFVNDDYERYDSDVLAPDTIDYVTLRTAGTTTMGYYAQPDPVYHPNYTAGGGWTLNAAGFTWDWTVLPAMTIAKPGAANYVTIAFTATGAYNVTVAEHAPLALGNCADITPTLMTVNVIAPPVATITTADPVTQSCGVLAPVTVNMTFTEAVPANWAGYALAVNQLIENIDAGGAVIGLALLDADTIDFPTTAKLNTTNDLTGAASPYGYSFATRNMVVINGLRTRYTYTLVGASDAASNGLISAISQKSDYLIAPTVNTYAWGAKSTYVAIVNPAPSTGPIYYVPNSFNY